MSQADPSSPASFFLRNEFAIRRVHSLLGIVPLGLYMVVHLTTNASMLNGSETFQRAVYLIHSPGNLLPLIEWGLIFLPLIFHVVIGIWIIKSGQNNSEKYTFTSNRRYAWQRWTGVVAMVYLFFHILHLHGWSHAEFWLNLIQPLQLAQFKPYNAASTLVTAMNGWFWPPFYLVGVLACIYHLANGLWTAGITWGLWVSPAAQQRATKLCLAFGIGLGLIGISAWWGAVSPTAQDAVEMRQIEDRMYRAGVESGMVPENSHKRSLPAVKSDTVKP